MSASLLWRFLFAGRRGDGGAVLRQLLLSALNKKRGDGRWERGAIYSAQSQRRFLTAPRPRFRRLQ